MKFWILHIILFSLCLLISCEKSFDSITPQKSEPPEPPIITTVPPAANLIFVRGEPYKDSDIYFLDTLGQEKRLTFGGMNPDHIFGLPVFSPNGSKIAFSSKISGNYEIYMMNVDGSNLLNLTSHPERDDTPVFSPDGSYLIFNSNRSGNWEIYSMNLQGKNQSNLTQNNTIDSDPSFLPDGSKIIFSSNRDGDFEVYIMDVDGQNQQNLTQYPGSTIRSDDLYPQSSPDGSLMMFCSRRDLGENLYIMDHNGNNQKFLVRAGEYWGVFFNKTFSLDSKYIIYEQRNLTDFTPGIYRIDIGSNDNQLLSAGSLDYPFDGQPALSPDGSKIAFFSCRDGHGQIYQMNLDGTEQVRLTDDDRSDQMPVYQPIQR